MDQDAGSRSSTRQTCICHFCPIPSPAQFFERTTFQIEIWPVLSHQELIQMPLNVAGASRSIQFPLKSLESNWRQYHANTAITYNVWLKLAIYGDMKCVGQNPGLWLSDCE